MNTTHKLFLIIVGIVGLLGCLTLLPLEWHWLFKQQAALPSHKKNIGTLCHSALGGDVIVKGACMHEYSKDQRYEAIITTDQSTFTAATNMLSCLSITCTIMHNTKPCAYIKAQLADIDRIHKKVFLNGTVDGHMDEITLQAKNIVYDIATGIIATEQPVTYAHPSGFFTAEASTIDTKNKTIKMSGGVYTEFSSH